MGRIIACIGNYAKTPYYYEDAGIHFYAIEELCYYICENALLLDKSFICTPLIQWIDEECGLSELAKQLYTLQKKPSLSLFIIAILQETHYCSQKELKEIELQLHDNSGMSEWEKKKIRADHLFGNHNYHMALLEYMKIAEDIKGKDSFFVSNIFHNMGVVYARLFQFEKAKEYFHKAYESCHNQESKDQFLFAEQLETESATPEVSDGVYQLLEEQWKESEVLQTIKETVAFRSTKNAKEYYSIFEDQIKNLKNEYRELVRYT